MCSWRDASPPRLGHRSSLKRRSSTPADRAKLVGLGSANWSVICPTPDGFVYPEPGEGVDETSDIPPLWQAYTGRRRDDGLLEIPGLRPEIGADRLHHGPMLVVTEAAALEAGAEALGTDALGVDQLTTTIVAPGRVGPFVAVPVARSGSVTGRRPAASNCVTPAATTAS